MIQSIIDGIIAAIRTEYDKSFRIYTESVEQGLTEPCFSVLCLNASDEQGVGSRHNRTYPFNITYFPVSTDEPRIECLKVMESLYDLLNLIDADGDKLRGRKMSGTVVDGLLQFQVTYAFFLLATSTETSMEELKINTNGKE